MKIVTANGKKKIVMNRKEWEAIGKTAGWSNDPGRDWDRHVEEQERSEREWRRSRSECDECGGTVDDGMCVDCGRGLGRKEQGLIEDICSFLQDGNAKEAAGLWSSLKNEFHDQGAVSFIRLKAFGDEIHLDADEEGLGIIRGLIGTYGQGDKMLATYKRTTAAEMVNAGKQAGPK
jgi:hypothetical protein